MILVLLLVPSGLFASQGQKYSLAGQLTVEIIPGSHFENTGWFFIFPFKKGPQMAAWIENDQGGYLETIFVTQKAGSQKWLDAPTQGRPEGLPVWTNRVSQRGAAVDAVTVATTTAQVDKSMIRSALVPGKYVVYLEVNISYDWNPVWAKDLPKTDVHYNGVNGQPSLVYRAEIEIGHPGMVSMLPWGTGSPLGQDGVLTQSLSGLDTALEILSSAQVTVLH
jgi:hypothetical protein